MVTKSFIIHCTKWKILNPDVDKMNNEMEKILIRIFLAEIIHVLPLFG